MRFLSQIIHRPYTSASRPLGKLQTSPPDKVPGHALSDLVVRPTPIAPLLRPARPQRSLPSIQAVQPATDGRWLGGNRRNPSQLVAPATACQCPRHSVAASRTGASDVEHLTGCLIKVIKLDQLPAFLRYNLPPIIRTSPDRASQHRQCPGIGTQNRPQRAAHTDRVKLARLPVLPAKPRFSRICRAVIRSATALFCPCGMVPGWDSPFLRFTSSKEREKNGFSQLHKSVASK